MEFRVWADLIQESRGMLHIFLPLLDRGLDGVVHRLTDGEYIPLQVKGRGVLRGRMIEVTVRAHSLVDDGAVMIAGLLTDAGLGQTLLVVDEGTFKRHATRTLSRGMVCYSTSFAIDLTADDRWRPYLVPREGLAAKLLGGEPPPTSAEDLAFDFGLEPRDRHDSWLGFLGESEVLRRLAENSQLDLFRPFPDLEMVEVLARDNVNGRFVGLQVKAAIPAEDKEAHITIQTPTFVPSPSTWVIALAWLPIQGRFSEQCLLVPSERLRDIAVDGGQYLALNFNPESPVRTLMDPYRCSLASLGVLAGKITAGERD